MSRAPACTPGQLDIIRTLAPTTTDAALGKQLGFCAAKVQYIRTRHGIPSCNRARWPAEQRELIRVAYVVEGLTAREAGHLHGATERAVRALAAKYHWERPKVFQFENAAIAVRARMPAKAPKRVRAPRGASQAPKPFQPPPTRFLTGSDAELVADFLSRKAVTILPAGTAAGLSAMEQMFFAARPELTGTKAQIEKNRLSRLRGSIVKWNDLRKTAAMGVAAE